MTFTINTASSSEPKLQTRHYLSLFWNPKPDDLLTKTGLNLISIVTVLRTIGCSCVLHNIPWCRQKCFPTPSGVWATYDMVFYTPDMYPVRSQRVIVWKLGQSFRNCTLLKANAHVFPEINLIQHNVAPKLIPSLSPIFHTGLRPSFGWFMMDLTEILI